jgi:PIN domain nuclease of toxin-antitoxin system
VLLDSHIALWFAAGTGLSARAAQHINDARNGEGVYLSAVTVWEVGNLIRKRRVGIDMTLLEWVRGFLGVGGFQLVDLTVGIVIEAASLPGHLHDDPADRFLVATARHLDVPIVTRDKRILSYAKAGHVRAIRC